MQEAFSAQSKEICINQNMLMINLSYMLHIRHLVLLLFVAFGFTTATAQQQLYPKPYGVLPTENHLRWHEMESYVLIHFTPTTFENKEWGYGDADPSIFNPTQFDAQQIVNAAKAGGFKGVVFVAKHHDGFALWPTKTTAYNISKSPWKDGKGDMVKEFAQASKKAGMQFGVYCSPWDRNHPGYGTAAYVTDYRNQLRELYTNYGELFITWFDGANGGDGYYGGANEKRNIDRTTYYGWDSTWNLVRTLQPKAVIFSDMGDVRWVGNEHGHAAETSWATFTPVPTDGNTVAVPGEMKYDNSPGGTRNGEFWKPAECDVPLRPGWFYHPDQDKRVKTPAQLLDLYFKSVGRGGNLDLGLSPDTRGLLHDNDVESLKAFGEILKETFAENLVKKASISASNVRGDNKLFSADKLIDANRYSYWATDDDVTKAEVLLEWKEPQTFNVIRLRENIKLGQRIEKLAVDVMSNGLWKQVGDATSIGANRLIRLPATVKTDRLRIRILESPVSLALSDIGVFRAPDSIPDPSYAKIRGKAGIDRSGWKLVESTPAKPGQVTIDMGQAYSVKAFTYQPQAGQTAFAATSYEWQVSVDGKNWKTVSEGEFSNIKANPIEQLVVLKKPEQVRYFRFIGKNEGEVRTGISGLGAIEE